MRIWNAAEEIGAIVLIQNWDWGNNYIILKYFLGFSALKGDSDRK